MGFFDGSQKSISAPWDGQRYYITAGFGRADDNWIQQRNRGAYTGPTFAGPSSLQNQVYNSAAGYLRNSRKMGNALARAGQGFVDQGRGIIGQGQGLVGSGMGAYNAAMGAWQPNMDRSLAVLRSNAAEGAQNNINRFMNNDILQGQIDAIGQDVARNLNEGPLRQINSGAAGAGASLGSRAGIAEGVARRGATEELSQAAAGLRGAAYNNALNAGLQSEGMNRQGAMDAMGLIGDQAQLGLSGVGAGTGLMGQGAGIAGMGAGMQGQGLGMVQDGLNTVGAIGSQQGAMNQARLDDQRNRWYEPGRFMDQLNNNYWNIVGSNNWGGYSVNKDRSSVLSNIGQIAGIASTAVGMGMGMPGMGGGGMMGGGMASNPAAGASPYMWPVYDRAMNSRY